MKKPGPPALMLDLEEQLAADADGTVKARLLQRLESINDKLTVQLRAMNDRDTYRKINASIDAVHGALLALRTLKTNGAPTAPSPERVAFSISTFIK